MKRFHVHLIVRDLDESIGFYSHLFAARPSVHESGYAKWMLEDPRLNFAISTRTGQAGIEHLGIQAEDAEELAELGRRLDAAGQAVLPEAGAECCYARSDKFWTVDPQGTRWETFHSVGSIASYYGQGGAHVLDSINAYERAAVAAEAGAQTRACCDATTPQGVCCAPKADLPADAPCCGPVAKTVRKAACAMSGCDTPKH